MVKTSPSNARGAGLIPGLSSTCIKTKDTLKKKKKLNCNKFNKNLKK